MISLLSLFNIQYIIISLFSGPKVKKNNNPALSYSIPISTDSLVPIFISGSSISATVCLHYLGLAGLSFYYFSCL